MAIQERAHPPFVLKPNDKGFLHGARGRMAATGLATAIGLAGGLGIYNYFNQENKPGIEQIEVSDKGLIQVMNLGDKENPFNFMAVRGTTVVAIEKAEGEKLLIAVSVPGEKINKKVVIEYVDGGTFEIPTESYSGTTIWFEINKNTPIVKDSYFPETLGKGPEDALKYIKVGETVVEIDANLSYQENWSLSNEEVEENKKAWELMNSKIDQSLPRSDKSFIFNPSALIVNNP